METSTNSTVGKPTEREVNQFYAEEHGYFWLECTFPGCGRMFGGHEMGNYTIQDPDDENLGTVTCTLHNDFARLMLSQRLNLADYYSSDGQYHWTGDPVADIKHCRTRDIPLPDFERSVEL